MPFLNEEVAGTVQLSFRQESDERHLSVQKHKRTLLQRSTEEE